MTDKRLLISFSGGETSAYMAQWLLANQAQQYDDVKVVFANTGQENEETLDFVEKCSRHFGFNTIWVEAVVHHGVRKSPTAKVVTYETADREGRVFEEVIKKYGIPNTKFPHCTRALKLNPIQAYLTSIGWNRGSYDTAIGIRIDEVDRISSDKDKNRIVYPLVHWHPCTKPKINTWWASQPFRLRLKGYQGNCKWCWKKSLRKHMTIMSEQPSFYNFPDRMEKTYSQVGPEFRKDHTADYRRTFFRDNQSVEDLRAFHASLPSTFVPAPDDASVFVEFSEQLDVGGGCSESCEVFTDETISFDLT